MIARLLPALVAVALAPVGHAADPRNPHVWEPKVKSVAVFKNGLGFFVREGPVTLRDGWCVAGEVPPALFGTYGVYALDEPQTVDLVGVGPGERVEFKNADPAAKRAQLRRYLDLNVALTATAGRLMEVTDDYALLRRDNAIQAVPLRELTQLQVQDYPCRIHVDGPPPADRPTALGMSYLRKGITWIPEYSLRILDETTAELTLRATLVNEAEDLVDADVHFVVGVPGFLHTEYLTPLAVGHVIRAVASAVPPQVQSQIVAAIGNRAAVAADQRAEPPPGGGAPPTTGEDEIARLLGGLPQVGGAGASDYTVYTRSGMTVRRGEKAVVTVFRRKITYTHQYGWQSPGALRHFLVLSNDTDTAWTTGPVVAVSGPRPLCEDLLTYTPKGGQMRLPVTTAVNVSTGESETEVDRKLRAHELSPGHFLDLVTIEGTLRVRNYGERPIELTVERAVPGRPRSASHDGQLQQDTGRLGLLELQGTVRWELTVAPGEQRELTYRYERYVSNRPK